MIELVDKIKLVFRNGSELWSTRKVEGIQHVAGRNEEGRATEQAATITVEVGGKVGRGWGGAGKLLSAEKKTVASETRRSLLGKVKSFL